MPDASGCSAAGNLPNTIFTSARAPFIDEDLIKELVRDFQKALLQADVSVHLVCRPGSAAGSTSSRWSTTSSPARGF